VAAETETENPLAAFRSLIDSALQNACELPPGCPPRLAEAIRYSLLAPGKRLRPTLVLSAVEACGGTLEDALPAAVAVEMIHAYSLVHDDLPAMDDDDLRRGRPTTHIAFDEATAILVGDALQALAFETLATKLPATQAARACAELARAAGPAALVGGQADDLAAETSSDHTLDQLESIHRRKTAALLVASLRLGGICADASAEQLARLEQFGLATGLAFQITDDLLDITASTADLGKRSGKDDSRGKLTYPSQIGVEASRAKAIELTQVAQKIAMLFGPQGSRLHWIAGFVLDRSR
jgi:geranylgeranyl diphosphate synthase, type II